MQNYNDYNYDNAIDRKSALASQMARVFGWMFIGLMVTGLTALFTATSPAMLRIIYTGRFTIFGLMILELVFVWFISSRAMKMEYGVAAAAFILYSILNGLTLSSIFFAYTFKSIALAFFMSAGFFGFMSVYGMITKTDLTSLGSLFIMGLVGLIIVSIVNIFLHNPTLYWIISFVGVAIFLGLTAYDSQKIKDISIRFTGTEKERNVAIVGALILYLDFINLFLYILRILGKRK
ncbi:Bax inhibitor-1/YccA family protein [Acetivibrio cellulolyticus]|uniref:Bax inhibitor-1/YccA family protein n=1 Tax=Acetivibrio cellulolyticus TaxID=35830 RepID=UPI0001E2D944|nr:Bax inhibitor-1/YccA family protein [Acetivibrio cellulolyticus]